MCPHGAGQSVLVMLTTAQLIALFATQFPCRSPDCRSSRWVTDAGEEDELGLHVVEGKCVQHCAAAADLWWGGGRVKMLWITMKWGSGAHGVGVARARCWSHGISLSTGAQGLQLYEVA